MKITRIFHPTPLLAEQTVVLTDEAAHHVAVVLRMRTGEALVLFCGDDVEYHAVILEISKRKVTVAIECASPVSRESPCSLHLAQAISKGDRMEWVVQKAVELGVKSITPILSKRCVVRLDEERLHKKQQQWQFIARSACEQSGRNVVPLVERAMALNDFVKQCDTPLKLMLDPSATASWRTLDWSEAKSITLLIGPEGGFTNQELLDAQKSLFQTISLGPRILRTETAAITALSILQAMGGDL